MCNLVFRCGHGSDVRLVRLAEGQRLYGAMGDAAILNHVVSLLKYDGNISEDADAAYLQYSVCNGDSLDQYLS